MPPRPGPALEAQLDRHRVAGLRAHAQTHLHLLLAELDRSLGAEEIIALLAEA